MVEVVYDKGETAIITCQIKDTDTEELVDPDTVKITIITDNTIKVNNVEMLNPSRGNYFYDYITDTVGRHYTVITADQVDASRITIAKDTFMVI